CGGVGAAGGGGGGKLLVYAENLVKGNGDNPMIVLNQIKPVFVGFGVPERFLGAILKLHSRRRLVVTAVAEKDGMPSTGTLSVIDNTVDPNTGTIRLKAVFDNTDGRVWPGQVLNIVLPLDPPT